jgi:hypothetical protein
MMDNGATTPPMNLSVSLTMVLVASRLLGKSEILAMDIFRAVAARQDCARGYANICHFSSTR